MSEHHNIEPVSFTEALGERYLAYALSTIMSRSLPDVRDGLKPVHRRLLYAMLQLKLDPKSGFKKCARVVGDVIGKYHPHGDVAVYETLVRLAQEFSVRYPLIEGQGNFGSIDGDNAAAMRYTESRLTDVAMALLADIDKDTVNFRPTYDGQEQEPVILPSCFPNLLANGSEGIAVGMATSIPPHNASELCDGLLQLIKNPATTIAELATLIPGPDFPTGGVLIEPKESILNAYETGKGSFRLRARWHKEELNHGLYQIVITEIPFQVQKSRLIEKIADLFREKKLVLLGNIRDESAEEIRIVLEPKTRTVDADMLMESCFKLTELESRISLNMNVLTKDAVPQVLNLKQVLEAFLEHRHEIVTRRSRYRLAQIDHRMEVLAGMLIAYLNLDEVIRIIREEDDAKVIMMAKWQLSEVQVEAILNMRLRSLRKLEEIEIRKEHDGLSLEKEALLAILEDDAVCWKVIADEVKETRKKFGAATELGKRRTDFADKPAESQVISIEAFIEREPLTILCSKMGWIRSVKGHSDDVIADAKYKDGDEERFIIKALTTDKLMAFSKSGRFYTLPCDKLPKGKGHGEPLSLMIDLDNDDEIIAMFAHQPQRKLLVASASGRGFVVEEDETIAQTRSGKQILNLVEGDSALLCKMVEGDAVAVIGENRKLVIFGNDELPVMRRGQGVMLQKYKHAGLADVKFFTLAEGLSWKSGERTRTEVNLLPWRGKRGSAGRLPPVGFPRNNKF
jgi:topoisomerase-4 subunit A